MWRWDEDPLVPTICCLVGPLSNIAHYFISLFKHTIHCFFILSLLLLVCLENTDRNLALKFVNLLAISRKAFWCWFGFSNPQLVCINKHWTYKWANKCPLGWVQYYFSLVELLTEDIQRKHESYIFHLQTETNETTSLKLHRSQQHHDGEACIFSCWPSGILSDQSPRLSIRQCWTTLISPQSQYQ